MGDHRLFLYPCHRQDSETLGGITKNESFITSYKGETNGAKREPQKTPVDPRKLNKEGCAP